MTEQEFYWFDSSDSVAVGPYKSYVEARRASEEGAPSDATAKVLKLWSSSPPRALARRKWKH